MKNPKLTLPLLLTMIIGEIIFLRLTTRMGAIAEFHQLLIASIGISLGLILFIAILKLIAHLFQGKNKIQNSVTSKEFWFKCIKGGFILWVVMIIIIGLDQLFM